MDFPTFFKGHVIESKHRISKYGEALKGRLTCCGQSEFAIRYIGKKSNGDDFLCQEGYMHATAVCKVCGNEISVFDNTRHGYLNASGDTELLAFSSQEPLGQENWQIYSCAKCWYEYFEVEINLGYPDAEELESLGVTEKDNAFTTMGVYLQCTSCGRKHEFLDLELD